MLVQRSSLIPITDLTDLTGPMWALSFVLLAGLVLLYNLHSRQTLPLVNGSPFLESGQKAKHRFLHDARNLISSGLRKWPVFTIVTENGRKTVLDPKYCNEIRNHPDLNFGEANARDNHPNIPGFEPFRLANTADEIFQDAIRLNLTQKLGSMTLPLSEETTVALETYWTNNPDWHAIPLKPSILKIVAQLSAKVFLGDEMCHHPDWLRITVDYTVDVVHATEALRLWPRVLRPLVAPFLESCQKVRRHLQQSRDLIIPVLEKRKAEKQTAIEQAVAPKKYSDAMEWMEQRAKGRPYDAISSQLLFSVAAIHTVSDMATQVLFDICRQDGLVEALREEIITIIKQEGWQKSTLYKLKLMDSTLKESQRLKPINVVSMRRVATKTVTLSDGTVIPKDTSLFVSSERMWDPSVYHEPEKFDPYRFLKLREIPGNETAAQLVSSSPEHLGFGLGKHACPGRFLAANEIKIALCHILLKYDVRLVEGCIPQHRIRGWSLTSDPTARMEIRRRKEEVDL